MKRESIIIGFILLVLVSQSCKLTMESSEAPTYSYLESIEVIRGYDSNPNLRISTLDLEKDYILCSDGEVIGIIKKSSLVDLRLDIEEDSLKHLWIIPCNVVQSEDDIKLQNSSFTWVTKIYKNSKLRVWDPLDLSSTSTEVTFKPNSMGSKEWDYVIGYLNGDESYTPVAILTPLDISGVKSTMDYGRVSINWKFYSSSQNDSSEPVEIFSSNSEFILREGDFNKEIILPIFYQVTAPVLSLSVTNLTSEIIELNLNGKLIEHSMTQPLAGYSYIEGFSTTEYKNLLINTTNTLIINSDKGEIDRFIFSPVEGEGISISLTLEDGIVVNEI